MDSQQALAQISSMYTDVGHQLWAMFGDLIVVVAGLVSCSLLVLGMHKIKELMQMAQTRYALSNLEMENHDLNQNGPIGTLEMESDCSWSDRKQQKLFSHY